MPASPIATTFVRDGRLLKAGPVLMRIGCGQSEFLGERSGFHER